MTEAEERSALRSALAGTLRPREANRLGLDARRFSTVERQAIFAIAMAHIEMTGRAVPDRLLLRCNRVFEDSTPTRIAEALAETRHDPAEQARVEEWDEVLP